MQDEIRQGYKQTEVGVIPEDWEVKPLPTTLDFTLRANKSETFDWLKFRLEGEGDRTHGNAFTDAAFTGYRI